MNTDTTQKHTIIYLYYRQNSTKSEVNSGFEHWKEALSLTECAREIVDQAAVQQRWKIGRGQESAAK